MTQPFNSDLPPAGTPASPTPSTTPFNATPAPQAAPEGTPAPQPAAAVPPLSDTVPLAGAEGLADQLAEMENLRGEITQLSAKNADLADQFLRAQAEVQNARRRADDEIAKVRKFAVESFAESLLPVLDSLTAALAVENATAEQLREGTEATLRQLMSALERNKVVEVNPAAGDRFDPTNQQAISMVPAEQEANTVVHVLQKGYTIADRVLRPALVTVAQAK